MVVSCPTLEYKTVVSRGKVRGSRAGYVSREIGWLCRKGYDRVVWVEDVEAQKS